MATLLRRLRSGWSRHGPLGFGRLVLHNIAYQLKHAYRNVVHRGDTDAFDALYGGETSVIREIGSLDIRSPNAAYAVRYQPSAAALVRSAIDELAVDYAEFTFIDYGSGKGRVLLLAAGYPFREVIGIEFCRELYAIGLDNINKIPSQLLRARRISTFCSDAVDFELPAGDLICYFYNPFGPPVLASVARRLAAHGSLGHRVIIIYVDAQHPDLLQQAGFRVIRSSSSLLVLSTTDRPSAPSTIT